MVIQSRYSVTYTRGRLVGQQRGAERSLGQQQLRRWSCLSVLMHLLLQVTDEHGALLRRLPAWVFDGEMHQRQLRLPVLSLLVHRGLRLTFGHPLSEREKHKPWSCSHMTTHIRLLRAEALITCMRVLFNTCGFPCRLMSIWANEQMSPTPPTSTVKLRKKSMISKDLLRRGKMRMKGVIMGLRSSSNIKTCRTGAEKWEKLMEVIKTAEQVCNSAGEQMNREHNRCATSDKLLDNRCRAVRCHYMPQITPKTQLW